MDARAFSGRINGRGQRGEGPAAFSISCLRDSGLALDCFALLFVFVGAGLFQILIGTRDRQSFDRCSFSWQGDAATGWLNVRLCCSSALWKSAREKKETAIQINSSAGKENKYEACWSSAVTGQAEQDNKKGNSWRLLCAR